MAEFLRARWPWLSAAARLIVGGVWIAAGGLKLLESPEALDRAVRAYQILPEWLVPWIGRGLPAFEVIIGILLILGLGLRLVSVLSGLLLLAFIIGISSAWARGLRIECGCFGGGGQAAAGENTTRTYALEILRDVGLFVLSGCLALWPRSQVALDRVINPPVEASV